MPDVPSNSPGSSSSGSIVKLPLTSITFPLLSVTVKVHV
jgi:hypothetical protein